MAYDSARGVVVLFGGGLGDTWEWDGDQWAYQSVSGPSPRCSHAMAYDSARGVTVLFGGTAGTTYSDTWEYGVEQPNELYIEEPNTPLWGNVDEYDAICVINGGSIVVPPAVWNVSMQEWDYGYLMLEAETIFVDSTSAIHADGCGFHEDDGHSDGGPGAGQDFFHDGGASALKSADGAGYGGRGGHYWTTVGTGGDAYRDAYWDQDDPHVDYLFGSQGGDLRWQQWPYIDEFGPGGRGGGYVCLRGSTVTVEGTVTANGADGDNIDIEPSTFGGGGGSGDQIVFDSPNLTVTGTVQARGGDGSYPSSDYSGGGGAGGRIKILQPSSDICDGTFSVGGGSGCAGMGNGQAGTIYIPDAPPSDAPTISGLTEDTGRDPSDLITKDPRISGTAEPGGIVRLYAGENLVGSGEADGGTGAFTVAANGASDGTVEVTATAQGNCHGESAPSDPFTFTYDTEPPLAPSTPDLHPSSDTGRFDDDFSIFAGCMGGPDVTTAHNSRSRGGCGHNAHVRYVHRVDQLLCAHRILQNQPCWNRSTGQAAGGPVSGGQGVHLGSQSGQLPADSRSSPGARP
ncbi:MAG: hypothetical protein KAY37_00855 [Phycisphaerae bacterium]|nr:hypothetical protein [Phycisphaerae bacterium]